MIYGKIIEHIKEAAHVTGTASFDTLLTPIYYLFTTIF